MNGDDALLLRLLEGHDKLFLIPVYQRNYDWSIPNCKQLFDDLVKVISDTRQTHFFGSIVYSCHNAGLTNEYLIIDGQQRLTTIFLLLLAMYNLLKKGKIISRESNLAQKIHGYLVDEYAASEKKIKLKLMKNDDVSFRKLFEEEENCIRESKLTENYNYFHDRIQKKEVSIDDLFVAIYKLQIIYISLEESDDPQLIFESLNSTGLNLTEGDKIRNFVLMSKPREVQNEIYDTYWNPIENATEYDVSSFVRDYLSAKTLHTPSISKVYENFKQYVRNSEIDTEKLLEDLLQFAKFYEILIKAKSSYSTLNDKIDDELRETINRLNWLETTVTRPFFLEVLRLFFIEKSLTLSDLHHVFEIVESYIFRRYICDVPTNSLNKIFLTLNREIFQYDNSYDKYIEKMQHVLLSKKENGRYPNDEEFCHKLSEKNIYNMRNRYRTYILERYENFGTREVKDIYKGVDNGTYTIEHIMPQRLTPKWINDIGQDYQTVHDKWLHRMANLTLTAYNSKYSNESFEVKNTLVDKSTGLGIGFSNSGLRMNQWIATKNQWTEKELIERDQHMLNLARKIWPYIHTEFKPEAEPLDTVKLSDEADLTGRQVCKFSYNGAEQPVTSWADAYMRILRILHQQDESVLFQLAYSNDPNMELANRVTMNPDGVHSSSEVADGIYADTGTSTRCKISDLNKFFKLYDADSEDLVFYLK